MKLRKDILCIVGMLSLLLIFCAGLNSGSNRAEIYFSPNGGAAEAIAYQIGQAKEKIDVAMYAFTSRELAWALVDARKRGVEVRVLLDGDFARNTYSKGVFLDRKGLNVRLDMSHLKASGKSTGRMHHKFALIDNRVVIAGSYNWTASAERRNDEVLLVFQDDQELAQTFEKEFERLWSRGTPFQASLVGKEPEEPAGEILVIPATDLAKLRQNAEKTAKVQGKVYEVYHSKRSDTYFLDFGPEKEDFTGVIFRSAAKRFRDQGIDPMEYEGKTVALTGKVSDHPKYGLQIIVEDPAQVEVSEEE